MVGRPSFLSPSVSQSQDWYAGPQSCPSSSFSFRISQAHGRLASPTLSTAREHGHLWGLTEKQVLCSSSSMPSRAAAAAEKLGLNGDFFFPPWFQGTYLKSREEMWLIAALLAVRG